MRTYKLSNQQFPGLSARHVGVVPPLSCRGSEERSLHFLWGQPGRLSGFPSLQLLLEEEQVDVDDVI